MKFQDLNQTYIPDRMLKFSTCAITKSDKLSNKPIQYNINILTEKFKAELIFLDPDVRNSEYDKLVKFVENYSETLNMAIGKPNEEMMR